MIFIIHSVNVMFSYYPWDKAYLEMVYEFFHELLNLVGWYFVKNFCFYIHQGYWPIRFFREVHLSDFDIRVILAS